MKSLLYIVCMMCLCVSCKKKVDTYYYEYRNQNYLVHIDPKCDNIKNGIVFSQSAMQINSRFGSCCNHCMDDKDMSVYWNLPDANKIRKANLKNDLARAHEICDSIESANNPYKDVIEEDDDEYYADTTYNEEGEMTGVKFKKIIRTH